MKTYIPKFKNYFTSYIEVLIALIVFLTVIFTGNDFYYAVILMLEFIVIMEIIKMISDFIKQETLQLRYVIDIFIIFLIREVVILSADKNRDYIDIVFLLFVIFIFFLFRILAIKFNPNNLKLPKSE